MVFSQPPEKQIVHKTCVLKLSPKKVRESREKLFIKSFQKEDYNEHSKIRYDLEPEIIEFGEFHKFSKNYNRLDPDLITMDIVQARQNDQDMKFLKGNLEMRKLIFKGIVDYSLTLSCQLLSNSHF